MIFDEFRLEMMSYRLAADDEAKALKNPYVTLERLRGIYEKFNDAERQMADTVFTEWALSEDESIRFDALALIGELEIKGAMPTLLRLTQYLALSNTPSAPYELKKVHRIIAGLEVA